MFHSRRIMGIGHLFRILLSTGKRQSDLCNHYRHVGPFVRADYFSMTTLTETTVETVTTSVPSSDERASQDSIEVKASGQSTAEVFRKWGCSQCDVDMIFTRAPALRKADVTRLESRLNLLVRLGLDSSDIVKMINCRPRLLHSRIVRYFDGRVNNLQELFGSKELFLKAIVRNPSLLTYDFHEKVKPVFSMYEQMGIKREELISMLMLRPMLIIRTDMNEEKLEFIWRTGVAKESKMYKYVISIIAISRLETLREKLANLERFGLSEDEVLGLFGRCPILMTLSLEKVERNMIFMVGTMKLPAKTVLDLPFLLLASLEAVLKPRYLLGQKIHDMNLFPQLKGPMMFTALRMSEQRFLKVFVMCHEEDIRDELLDCYSHAKRMKRLAASSKKATFVYGFPF